MVGKPRKVIDLTPPWRRVKYKDLIRERAGADWFDVSAAERRKRAVEMGAEIAKEYEDFEVTQAVFEKLIEPTLINPTFVTHAPKELIPLAKLSHEDPTTVEVFECCIIGLGIDRLCMMLLGQESIRDVILFPQLKPK